MENSNQVFIGNVEIGENSFTVHVNPSGSYHTALGYKDFEKRMALSVEFRPEFDTEERFKLYALLHTLQQLRWPLQKITYEGTDILEGFSFEVIEDRYPYPKTVKVELIEDEDRGFQFLPKDAPLTEDIISLLIENHTDNAIEKAKKATCQ